MSGSVDLDVGFSGEPLFNLLHWLFWETEACLHLTCSRQAVVEGELTNDCDVRGDIQPQDGGPLRLSALQCVLMSSASFSLH